MSKNYIVGIDPGFTGALAVLEIQLEEKGPNSWKLFDVHDMPVCSESISNDRPVVSGKDLAFLMNQMPQKPVFTVIEKVTASPQMGVTSAFRFGEGFGTVKGVFDGLGIRVISIVPQVWKAHYSLDSAKEKSLLLARRIFPNRAHWFKLKQDHGKAEAALISFYGLQKFRQPTQKVSGFEDLI